MTPRGGAGSVRAVARASGLLCCMEDVSHLLVQPTAATAAVATLRLGPATDILASGVIVQGRRSDNLGRYNFILHLSHEKSVALRTRFFLRLKPSFELAREGNLIFCHRLGGGKECKQYDWLLSQALSAISAAPYR